jgi:predicted small secreted protein
MKHKNKLTIVSIAAAALLAGCSSTIGMGSEIEAGPVGTGPTVKELKASPCACSEIPMKFPELAGV